MRPRKSQSRNFYINLFLLAALFQHVRAECALGKSGLVIQLLQKV